MPPATEFPRVRTLFLASLLALPLTGAAATPRQAEDTAGTATSRPASEQRSLEERVSALAPRYREWLRNVSGLITRAELDYFVDLGQDFQRDAFMETFWEPRDPDPQTRRNELRDRWQQAIDQGSALPLNDPRFLLYLLNGPPGGYTLPDGRPVGRCFSRSRELEIWFYGGSERTPRRFEVIFFRRSTGSGYEVYRQGDSVRAIPRTGRLPTTEIQALCADELLRFTVSEISRQTGRYGSLLEQVLTPPLPSVEWLANLALATTDVPAGAEIFETAVEIDFPARRQSRTAARVMLGVPTAEAPGRRFEDRSFHHFEVAGEVIRGGELFESFRYRFEGPTPEEAEAIPLGFTRYLRPGPVTLRLLVQDVFAGRYAQVIRELEVPSPSGLPDDPSAGLRATLEGRGANGTGLEGRPSLRLANPAGSSSGTLAGPVRFTAYAQGQLDKVAFYLDDRPIFTLRRPPWSVELNLGEAPAPHRVRVVGFAGDREVASDQIWLNQGAARFRVRLVEPRSGGIYPGSLIARVEVEAPEGQRPERIELWLDQERVATLTEPPLAAVVELAGSEPAVVRAVAYLEDGTSAEDAVLINATAVAETVEVRLVEVPVLVVDDRGEPIRDLAAGDFRLWDEGVPRKIERVLGPGQLPLRLALLIDRSASMQESLRQVVESAAGFAREALATAGDSTANGEPTPTTPRVAVLSFADRLSADAGFTSETAPLERALAGLVARGATKLYDAVAAAAASFGPEPGQRALVLFTDGRDEGSGIALEAAVAAARRHRVSLFVLAPGSGFSDRAARRDIERLAEETGGRTWLLDDLAELDSVYRRIGELLESRYLLTFNAPPDAGEDARELRVEVGRDDAQVEAQGAYYP